jgi:4-amino-4-deoxy-L-arabinose transferase-like glycosyltransferase
MIAMAKKRGDRTQAKRAASDFDGDLDRDYRSPIQTFHDLSWDNVRSVLLGSRYVQILLALTLIGCFLRFYDLGFNSLWLDEASTYTLSIGSIPQIWQETMAGEFNPPLFYWLEHLMLTIGNNEFILRFIPALLGVLTIPLAYLVGREFIDRNVGIIAAAAFAFSPFLIYYSQEARAYSMMLFFVAFAMVFYLRALKTNDTRNWALFGVLSALAFWSHFYAFVIIASLVLYALALRIKDLWSNIRNFLPIAAGLIFFIVLCLPLIVITIQLFATRTASAPTFGVQGLDVISTTFQQVAGFSDVATYLLLIFFVLGVIQAFRIERNKGLLLATLTVLTLVISFILSYKMPMEPRYLIFFSLIFFIGVAVSYRLFYSLINNRGIVVCFIAFFIILNAPTIANYYSGYTKDDWRGFSGQLQQLTKPGDIVVAVPAYIDQPLDYYYSNISDITSLEHASTARELAALNTQKNNRTIYYVVTQDISSADPSGDAIAWLKTNATFLKQDTGIYLFSSG